MSLALPPLIVTPQLLPLLTHLQAKYGFSHVPIIPLGFSLYSGPESPNSAVSITALSSEYAKSDTSSLPSTPSPSEREKSPIGCSCPVCGKVFSRHWLLHGHIRTHTGEKPFKCEHCGKAFADKSNLRAHVQTHSGVKPHECSRCGKRFALRSYLSKHEESSCARSANSYKL